MRKLLSFVLVSLTFSSLALAEDTVTVKRWFAGGTRGCSKNDIQLIANGNAISFLFNSFQSELRQGERRDGYAKTSVCVISVLLEVPENKCIDSMDQTVSGGVLKSENAFGHVHFLSWLNGAAPVNRILRWRRGNEITAEEEESLFTLSTHVSPRCLRARHQWFVAYLYLQGVRTNVNESFLGAIDSIDGEVTLEMRLR